MSQCALFQSKIKFLKQSLRELELLREGVVMGKKTKDEWMIQLKQFEQQKKDLFEKIVSSHLQINKELFLNNDFNSFEEKMRDLISKTDESFFKSILVELTKGLNWEQLENIKSFYLELLPKHLISKTYKEMLSGNFFVHDADVFLLNTTSLKSTKFPDIFFGNLDLSSLASSEGLTLPQTVGGDLSFRYLKKAEGLTLSQTIGRDLNLPSLTLAKDLVLPQFVGGYVDLRSLTKAYGLILPQFVGGNINLQSLASIEGLTFPDKANQTIFFKNLPKKDFDELVKLRPDLKFIMLKQK